MADELVLAELTCDSRAHERSFNVVAQRYITNPLLVNGKKVRLM